MDQHKDVVPALLVLCPTTQTSAPNQADAHLHKVREGTVQTTERKVTQHSSLTLSGVSLEYGKLYCFFSSVPGFAISPPFLFINLE